MRTNSLAYLIRELVVTIESTARQMTAAEVERARQAPVQDALPGRVDAALSARLRSERAGARQRATESA